MSLLVELSNYLLNFNNNLSPLPPPPSGLDLLSTLSRIRRSLDAASPASSSSSSGVAATETGVQLQLQLDVFDEQKIHDEDEFPELAANFNTPLDVFNNVFNKVGKQWNLHYWRGWRKPEGGSCRLL